MSYNSKTRRFRTSKNVSKKDRIGLSSDCSVHGSIPTDQSIPGLHTISRRPAARSSWRTECIEGVLSRPAEHHTTPHCNGNCHEVG
ncbi:hypothetical protein BJX76DRAFT_335051 [Aspergillus varians]